MTIIERVARVLAGQYYSRNAGGASGPGPASPDVDAHWPDFMDDAIAVLKTLRGPPHDTPAADAITWERMVEAAIAAPPAGFPPTRAGGQR